MNKVVKYVKTVRGKWKDSEDGIKINWKLKGKVRKSGKSEYYVIWRMIKEIIA